MPISATTPVEIKARKASNGTPNPSGLRRATDLDSAAATRSGCSADGLATPASPIRRGLSLTYLDVRARPCRAAIVQDVGSMWPLHQGRAVGSRGFAPENYVANRNGALIAFALS